MVPGPNCLEDEVTSAVIHQILALNLSLTLTFMKIKIQFVSSDVTAKRYS